MALSGSFNTTAYSNRHLVFSWTATQDIAKNQSTIKWTLKGAGNASGFYVSGPFKVVIDGETVYNNSTRIQLYNGTQVASGSKVITHNTNGSRSFAASVEAAIYYSSINCKGSGSWTLTDIPRKATITEAKNFTDMDNPVIKYSNPAGNVVSKLELCLSFDGSKNDIAYKELSKTGSSYTLNFTEAERTVLRKGVTGGGNFTTITYWLRTTIDGTYYYDTKDVYVTVKNINPVLNPIVKDIGSVSVQLTGDPNKMIRYYNYMEVNMGATPPKDGSITVSKISCGGKSVNGTSGSMGYVDSNVFTFEASSNWGGYTKQTVTVPMVEYIPLTCNVDAKIKLSDVDNTKASVEFTVSGNYFSGSFGAQNNNLTVSYVLVTGGTKGSPIALTVPTANIKDGKYSVTHTINNLDYKETYSVEAIARDKIEASGITGVSKNLRAIPIFDWGENDFNFNVPVSFQGSTMDDFIIETGTASMGSNGTWYWRKWKSGRADCYGCRNYGNMGVSNAWGSLYESATFTQSLPSGLFAHDPEYIDIQILQSVGAAWVVHGYGTEVTPTSTATFSIVRPVSGTLQQVWLGFNVIGRWK